MDDICAELCENDQRHIHENCGTIFVLRGYCLKFLSCHSISLLKVMQRWLSTALKTSLKKAQVNYDNKLDMINRDYL